MKRGECGATFDTDLYDVLVFEHLEYRVPQIFQVIRDGLVS